MEKFRPMVHRRCLIFTNLPFDLEEYILLLFKSHKKTQKMNLQTLYSSDQLVHELYRRSKLLPSETNTVPAATPNTIVHSDRPDIPPLPMGYIREFYRIYRMTLEDINATGLHFQNLEIHPLINLTYMMNNGVRDRMLCVDSIGYYETIIGLDRDLAPDKLSFPDIYDLQLLQYWNQAPLRNKMKVVNKLFPRMKTDFFSEHGVVMVQDRERKFRQSAMRVLRFAFINDVEKSLFETI